MSVKATSFVRRLRGLDPVEKTVAFVLADHANHETGDTYPSMDTVAEEAALASRQSASRVIQRLAACRVILSDEPSKGGKPTVWRFNYGMDAVPAPVTLAPVRNRAPRVTVDRIPRDAVDRNSPDAVQGNTTASQKNGTASQNRRTASPGMQEGFESNSKGKSNSKRNTGTANPAVLSLPEWLPVPEWNDFLAYRSERKRPLTPTAQKANLERLANLRRDGHDPAAVLNLTIASGWMTPQPLPENKPSRHFSPTSRTAEDYRARAEKIRSILSVDRLRK